MRDYFHKKIKFEIQIFRDCMNSKSIGFTVIELMVTILIASIILTIAVPSYRDLIDKYRLKSAAEDLYTQLQFARMEAIKRGEPVIVDFNRTSDTVWCYGVEVINAGEAYGCDCTTTDSCDVDGVEKISTNTEYRNVKIASSLSFGLGSQPYTGFNPYTGFAADGSGAYLNGIIQLESELGKKVNIDVSLIGRVKICSPSGSIGDYPSC